MRNLRPIAVFVLAITTLTGCFTGERPTFAPIDPALADPAIAAVLSRLETANTAPFTAQYNVLTKYGNLTTLAGVTQTGPTQSSVTIGTVRFLTDVGGTQTCDLALSTCTPGTVEAKVSNLSLTHNFYAVAPAARLRQDALVTAGAPIGSVQQIAGQTATCVEIPVAGGNKLYCALDNGLLALQDTPDLRIDLTALTNVAEPLMLTPTTIAIG
jgi:hypothetical protein